MDERHTRNKFPYRRMLLGFDFYWNVGNIYAGCDAVDMTEEQIKERYPGADVKRGRWVDEEEYKWAVDTANKARFVP